MIYLIILLVFSQSFLQAGANDNKPSIWIFTDLTDFGTVKKLIEDAGREKIFVLSWGSLSEPAMAVKHCSRPAASLEYGGKSK